MKEITKALFEVQKTIKNPKFDSVNPHFKSQYASLAQVLATVKAALNEHGILLYQAVETEGDHICVKTTLTHVESGESLEAGKICCPIPQKGENPLQLIGAMITYMRRYSIVTALGVVGDEDDDAESLTQSLPPRREDDERQRTMAIEAFRSLGIPRRVVDKISHKPLSELRALYADLKSLLTHLDEVGLKGKLIDILEAGADLEAQVKSFKKNKVAFDMYLQEVGDVGVVPS